MKVSKKIIACSAMSAALLTSYAGFAAPGIISADTTVLAGDINGDGIVNTKDLVSMRQYLIGRAEFDDNSRLTADVNSDGTINILDCIMLINKVVSPDVIDVPDVPADSEEKTITLDGSKITVTGTGTTVNASTVTVSEPGTYVVKGTLDDGQIIVDVDKEKYPEGKVELSLEGAEISCSNNSPVYIASVDDECVITVKKGTTNVITDGSDYKNADESAGAIYSKDDLKIKGKGSLTVNGKCSDGIVSKNSIKLFNGNITVNAVDDCIRGKDSVKIGDSDDTDFSNLVVNVNSSAGDGIKSTNDTETDKGKVIINGGTVNIKAFGDAVQGVSDVKVNGGTIDIYTYEGSGYTTGNRVGDGNANKMPTDLSAKGIKSAGTININGGTITMDTSDDAIHGAGNVNVVGGSLKLSTADDAVHSDEDITIGNGTAETFDDVFIYVPKCYEGIEGKNITQNSGTCIVYSDDDGYNAAGGADGSGVTGPGGWNQGGFGGFGSGGDYSLNLKGGFAYVSAADGDHDGFDSNGTITIDGAIAVSNGNEAFDSDGNKTFTSGTFIELKGNSGGMMGGFGGSELTASFASTISAAAGDRITVSDDNGNVIVSFIAGKSATSCKVGSKTVSSGKVNINGTVTGGTELPVTGDSQQVYVGGTVTGGTDGTAGSTETGNQPGFPGRWQ